MNTPTIKKFDDLKNVREVKIGKPGHEKVFYVSTIPAFYAQRILLAAGPALADLDLSKLPEWVLLEILSYCAFQNENGVPVMLDGIDMVNMCVPDPRDLIALELKAVEENFGFFFDGSLRELFQPLLEKILEKQAEDEETKGTSTP